MPRREPVECDVEYKPVENDHGRMIDGVVVTCQKCGHSAESCGTSARAVRRALSLLRESCPEEEGNYYIASNGEDED
jgi:hypothetical protein